MTWTAMLDILADLGTATVESLWLPVLAWTILAMTAYGVLQRCRLGVHLQYRVRQGLLIALPIGLLLGVTTSWVSNLGLFSPGIQAPLDLSGPGAARSPFPEATSSSALPSWSWLHAVGLLTVAACGIGAYRLTQFLADALALVRVRNQSDFRTRPSVQHLTDRLADDMDIQRSVRTRIAPGDIVPQTVGFFRPTIILPETLTEDRAALRMTLTHELVHVRRYDCVAQWVEHLVASALAVHPGVGILCRSIAHFREQSCDAAVLGTEAVGRSQYATLLYRFSTPLNSRNSVALRIGDADSSLQNRIRAMHEHPSSADSTSLLTGFTLSVLIVGLTVGVAACSDFGGKAPPSTAETKAQSANRSEALLSGRVVDRQTGDPIPRVNIIRAYGADEQSSRDGFGEGIGSTNGNGEFTASNLSPGSHQLIISCVGYERKTREITLRAGHPRTVTIKIQRETMSLQGVEVDAPRTRNE